MSTVRSSSRDEQSGRLLNKLLNGSPFSWKVGIEACDSIRISVMTAANKWRCQDPLESQSVRYMNIGRRQVELNARYLKNIRFLTS